MRAAALVGREPEAALLRAALDSALAGRPSVIVCHGEPGIGKTRLVEELADLAAGRDGGDCAVCLGPGSDSIGAPPFWPWIQVLRDVSEWCDVGAVAGELGLTADLARLAPDVFAAPPGAAGIPEDRFRQFDAVCRLLARLARQRPLVVALDDAQWADRPSILLARHLARTMRTERLLLLLTFRSTENPHAADVALLAREPVTRRLDLAGLSVSAVAQQLAGITNEGIGRGEAEQVHALTGGNPFFVTEVARLLPARRVGGAVTPLSPTVHEAVAARLSRLSGSCVELLQAGAVIGRHFSVTAAAAMLDRPALDCLASLDEACAAGLVEADETPGGHRFVHDLVRETIELRLSSQRRVHLHRVAADLLEKEPAGPHGSSLFELARHWAVASVAGERTTASAWIGRAAREAGRRLAYEQAVRLYRLALAVAGGELEAATECDLTLGLARALFHSGDLPACVDAQLAAAALAKAAGRPGLLAEAALAADAVGPTVAEPQIRRLCREASAVLAEDQVALRARVLARLAEACAYCAWGQDDPLDYETARTASAQALTLAEQCGDLAALRAALRAKRIAWAAPDGLEERERLGERMLALGRETGDSTTQMWARVWRIDAAFERGDLHEVSREVDALARCVQEVGGPHARFELLRCRAVLAQAQGRFEDALKLAGRAFTEIRITNIFGYAERAGLLTQIGEHIGHESSGSVEASGFADASVFEHPVQTAGVIIAIANADLLASVGRIDEARALYRSLGPADRWLPSPHALLAALAFGIRTAIAIGEDMDVEVLRDRLASHRGRHVCSCAGQVAYCGPVELWLGMAALHLRELDDAVREFEHAVQACAANGAAGFHVESSLLLATALAERAGKGDHAQARSLAESSLRAASRLGMTPFVARAEQLSRRLVRTGPLTRREWEVAQLVARGLTNRQIAVALSLSERTAQNHVQHILTNLGLANRSQITAWVTAQQ